MAAHMENLFVQAEQAVQYRDTTAERVVTRIAGRSLRWNQAMNSNGVLVEIRVLCVNIDIDILMEFIVFGMDINFK